MEKGVRHWAPWLALVVAASAQAQLKQVSYNESIQPTVRISGGSTVAGLSLITANGVAKGDTTFWAKLPKGFDGGLTLEVTTHDHRFQATVNFQGAATDDWQELTVSPKAAHGKSAFPDLDLAATTTALRAWIPGDARTNRRYVLIRWGRATDVAAFQGEQLRVQLNLGTAPEAAAWLRIGKLLKTGTCQPADKTSRTHVYFQWVCQFEAGLVPLLAATPGAKLIVKRRERDGRESDEVLEPQW